MDDETDIEAETAAAKAELDDAFAAAFAKVAQQQAELDAETAATLAELELAGASLSMRLMLAFMKINRDKLPRKWRRAYDRAERDLKKAGYFG